MKTNMLGATLLEQYLKDGTIWFDDGYVGKASDGVVVVLGSNKQDTAGYLAARPTPDRW